MNQPIELELDAAALDDEQPILVGGETAEEAALTTNIYSEIRRRLAARGIPPEEVAFIHDAKTPAERAALFQAVNQGKIRVLIGSTEKMGTGMNAQERLVAIHQITPPWRPGDLEQQAGRMIRQGNLYPEVFQFVHVTASSFDAYIWQLLENKAGFIGQIAGGEVTAREVDDVSENVLTFSEIKALASGNPKIMEKVLVDTELARLEAVRSAWRNAQLSARVTHNHLVTQLGFRENDIAAFEEAIAIRKANTTEKFTIQLRRDLDSPDLTTLTDREQAGKRIRALSAGASFCIRPGSSEYVEIGHYRGMELRATIVHTPTGPTPGAYVQIGANQLVVNIGESDSGITMSLDAKLRSFDSELEKAKDHAKVMTAKIASLEAEIGRPWDHEARYTELKAKSAALDAELNLSKKETALADGEGSEAATPESLAVASTANAVVDTSAEVMAAVAAIRALHSNPETLARFDAGEEPAPAEAPAAITTAVVADLERNVQQAQAQLDFAQAILAAVPEGETVQLGLFGDFAAAPTRKRRR